jgi:dCMP deaminase
MTNWDLRFLGSAHHIAMWSKDPSTKVGCVIVDDDRVIVSTGYNGLPRGVDDSRLERMARPAKYLWTSHAEENAVAQAARTGGVLSGSTAYVTHQPCARCARILIQAGVRRIVVDKAGKTNMPAEEFEVSAILCAEAGVTVDHV